MMLHIDLNPVQQAARFAAPYIVRRFVAPIDRDAPPPDFKPGRVLIFVGGGHASGKSLIKDKVFKALVDNQYLRNYLAQFGSDNFKSITQHPWIVGFRNNYVDFLHDVTAGKGTPLHQWAGAIFSIARQTAFNQGSPCIIDNHMDERGFVEQVLSEARASGYECIFIAPHVVPEMIFDRLERRKKETGIPYDRDRVLDSHAGFSSNLPFYFEQFDGGLLLDNNGSPEEMKPIAYKANGTFIILDPKGYQGVLAKAQLGVGSPFPDTSLLSFNPSHSRLPKDAFAKCLKFGTRESLGGRVFAQFADFSVS